MGAPGAHVTRARALSGVIFHDMTDRRPPNDTSPEALRLMCSLYARMSPAEKLRQMQQLTQTANQLTLSGLRRRHPEDTEPQLLLRLARIRLGDDVVAAVYSARTPGRGA